jgi:hypothetical protein
MLADPRTQLLLFLENPMVGLVGKILLSILIMLVNILGI